MSSERVDESQRNGAWALCLTISQRPLRQICQITCGESFVRGEEKEPPISPVKPRPHWDWAGGGSYDLSVSSSTYGKVGGTVDEAA